MSQKQYVDPDERPISSAKWYQTPRDDDGLGDESQPADQNERSLPGQFPGASGRNPYLDLPPEAFPDGVAPPIPDDLLNSQSNSSQGTRTTARRKAGIGGPKKSSDQHASEDLTAVDDQVDHGMTTVAESHRTLDSSNAGAPAAGATTDEKKSSKKQLAPNAFAAFRALSKAKKQQQEQENEELPVVIVAPSRIQRSAAEPTAPAAEQGEEPETATLEVTSKHPQDKLQPNPRHPDEPQNPYQSSRPGRLARELEDSSPESENENEQNAQSKHNLAASRSSSGDSVRGTSPSETVQERFPPDPAPVPVEEKSEVQAPSRGRAARDLEDSPDEDAEESNQTQVLPISEEASGQMQSTVHQGKMTYDDVPVGRKTNQSIWTEYPPGYAPPADEQVQPTEPVKPRPAPTRTKLPVQPTPRAPESEPVPERADPPSQPPSDDSEERPISSTAAFAARLAAQMALENAYPDGSSTTGEGPTAAASSVDEGPLPERLASKVLKTRMGAYDELRTSLSSAEEPEVTSILSQNMKAFASAMKKESVALAVDKALDAALAVVTYAPEHTVKSFIEFCGEAIVDQLKAPRKQTLEKVAAVLTMGVENGAGELVITALLGNAGALSKVAKLASEASKLAVSLVRTFGLTTFPASKINAALPEMSNHANGDVRRSAVEMCLEFYKWMGPGAKTLISQLGLRPATASEVDNLCQTYDERKVNPDAGNTTDTDSALFAPPNPTRFVRGKASAVASISGSKRGGAAAAVDAFDLLEAVDIGTKLPNDWYDGIKSAERVERKGKLEALIALLQKHPKLQNSAAIPELISALKVVITRDTIINCVVDAVRCLGLLASGLRAEFSQYVKPLVPIVLAQLKEKKPLMNKPVNETLDAFFTSKSIDFASLIPFILECTKDKIPHVRAQTLSYASRCAVNSKPLPELKAESKSSKASAALAEVENAYKTFFESILPCLDDADSEVRQKAGAALTDVARLIGPGSTISSLVAKLDAKHHKRASLLLNAASGATSTEEGEDNVAEEETKTGRAVSLTARGSVRSGSLALPAAEVAAAAAQSSLPTSRQKSASSSRPKSSTTSGPGGAGSAQTQKSGKSNESKEFKDSLTFEPEPVIAPEAAVEQLVSVAGIPSETFGAEGLGSKNWKQASDALEVLKNAICGIEDPATRASLYPALVSAIKAGPGYAPNNPNVLRAVYETLNGVIASLPPEGLSKTSAARPLKEALPRITERKAQEQISEYVLLCAEQVGPRFMLAQLHVKSADAAKNPKAMEVIVGVAAKLLESFGLVACDRFALMELVPIWIQNASGGVRKMASSIYVTMYRQSKGILRDMMLGTLPSAQATAVAAEFDAIPEDDLKNPSATPTYRQIKSPSALAASGLSATTAGTAAAGSGTASAPEANLDDLIPRVDISAQLATPIKLMTKATGLHAWKDRKQALDDIEAILNAANNKILPKDGGVFDALKERVEDTNKNIARQAIAVISMFITAMGPPIRSFAKKILPSLVDRLEDVKPQVRAEAEGALALWVTTAGLQSMVPYLERALAKGQTRKEILPIILLALRAGPLPHEGPKLIVNDLIVGVVSSLVDKLSVVRSRAEDILPHLVLLCGIDAVRDGMRELNGAQKIAVIPVIEKAYQEAQAARMALKQEQEALARAQAPQSGQAELEGESEGGTRSNEYKASAAVPLVAASGWVRDEESEALAAAAGSFAAPTRPETFVAQVDTRVVARTLGAPGGPGASMPAAAPEFLGVEEDVPVVPVPQTSTVVVSELPLKPANPMLRQSRLQRDARQRTTAFRELEQSELEDLKEDLRKIVTPTLWGSLFSNDFRVYINGIGVLRDALETQFPETLQGLDAILKYVAYRLGDQTNLHTHSACLSYLANLMQKLAEQPDTFKLADGDVIVLLPFLIERVVGHPQAKFRQAARELLAQIVAVYPGHKLLLFLVDGFNSKNKRVVAECIEEVGDTISRNGIGILTQPSRILTALASQVTSSDLTIRNAALNSIAKIFERSSMSETELWVHIDSRPPRLADKYRQLINDRISKVPARAHVPAVLGGRLTGSKAGAAAVAGAHVSALPAARTIQTARSSGASTMPASQATARGSGLSSTLGVSRAATQSGTVAAGRKSLGLTQKPRAVEPVTEAQPMYTVQYDAAYNPAPTPEANQLRDDIAAQREAWQRSNLQYQEQFAIQEKVLEKQQLQMKAAANALSNQGLHGSQASSVPPISTAQAFSAGTELTNSQSAAAFMPTASSAAFPSVPSVPPIMGLPMMPKDPESAQTVGGPSQSQLSAAPMQLQRLLQDLRAPNDEASIDALRRVWKFLQDSSGDSLILALALQPQVGELISRLVDQVNISFGAGLGGPEIDYVEVDYVSNSLDLPPSAVARPILHRLCKYALNTIMEVVKLTDLAPHIDSDRLRILDLALLGRLLDPRLKQQRDDEEVKGLIRGLNVLMLKVLENSDFTAQFHALVSLLSEFCSEGKENPLFTDLVGRCLGKLCKRLSKDLPADAISAALVDVHRFLVDHPPSSFPRAGTPAAPGQKQNDACLRAIRQTMVEFFKVFGDDLGQYIGTLPEDSRVVAWYKTSKEHPGPQQVPSSAASAASVPDEDVTSRKAVSPPQPQTNAHAEMPQRSHESRVETDTATRAIPSEPVVQADAAYESSGQSEDGIPQLLNGAWDEAEHHQMFPDCELQRVTPPRCRDRFVFVPLGLDGDACDSYLQPRFAQLIQLHASTLGSGGSPSPGRSGSVLNTTSPVAFALLAEIFAFRTAYPFHDIGKYVATADASFRDFVARALQEMAVSPQAAVHAAPSNVSRRLNMSNASLEGDHARMGSYSVRKDSTPGPTTSAVVRTPGASETINAIMERVRQTHPLGNATSMTFGSDPKSRPSLTPSRPSTASATSESTRPTLTNPAEASGLPAQLRTPDRHARRASGIPSTISAAAAAATNALSASSSSPALPKSGIPTNVSFRTPIKKE